MKYLTVSQCNTMYIYDYNMKWRSVWDLHNPMDSLNEPWYNIFIILVAHVNVYNKRRYFTSRC